MQSFLKIMFLDWDHCLFDTDLFFNVDVWNTLQEYSIPQSAWEQALQKSVSCGFTMHMFVQELHASSANLVPTQEHFRGILLERFADLQKYVFPDVREFLFRAKRFGWRRRILTRGSESWQEYKIRTSRIIHEVDDFIVVPRENGGKGEIVSKESSRLERILVIDNNPVDLDNIRDYVPHAETYLINRVPDGLLIPADKETERRFLEARNIALRPCRHVHQQIRDLAEIELV